MLKPRPVPLPTSFVVKNGSKIFARIAEHLGQPSLAGRFVLTAGLGGMGGAQPLAARMAGATTLVVEVDPARIEKVLVRLAPGLTRPGPLDGGQPSGSTMTSYSNQADRCAPICS